MRKIVVGYAACVLLAAGAGWALFQSSSGAVQSAVAVERALQFLQEINEVEAVLRRAESAQRGDEREIANARVHAAAIAKLAADDSSEARDSRALGSLLQERPAGEAPDPSGKAAGAAVYQLTARMRDAGLKSLERLRAEEARDFDRLRYSAWATVALLALLLAAGFAAWSGAARVRARARRSMLEQLAESLPGAVFQYRVFEDGTYRYELLSSATERIRGVDRAAALRDPGVMLDTILEPDRSQLIAKLAAYQSAMTPIVADYRARVGGQVRWIRTVAAPRKSRDGSVLWTGHWDDVTTRRELEEQLRLSKEEADAANRAKSTFLATMSHEIRTPMNGVLGMLELLSLSDLDEEQRATVNVVRESGQSLLRIIDDILDFSKVEAGKLELVPEPTSIRELVERVWGMYSGTASSKGLLLKRFFDQRIGAVLVADPVRLQQILGNFVSNALKFTSSGGASISVHLLERKATSEIVQFTVADSGVGLSTEQQARLFQPFTQVHDRATQRAGGTGLGLTISQRLAALMGGVIEMESEPGRGTRMTLTVELAIAQADSLMPSGAAASSRAHIRKAPSVMEAELARRLILVVDDHPVNRMVLLRQVNALGYAAETAEDGRDAYDKWLSGRFALIITDCNMPEISGYELAERVRREELEHGLARTLIIACTANALGGEAEKCLAAGMDDYVAKPVALDQLSARLARWLPHEGALEDPDFQGAEQLQPLDRATVDEICGEDDGLARELLARFCNQNDDDAQKLREAVARNDAEALRTYAHRMKGAARTIGAIPFARVCENIERAAGSGGAAAAADHLSRFDAEMDRLHAYIRQCFSANTSNV